MPVMVADLAEDLVTGVVKVVLIFVALLLLVVGSIHSPISNNTTNQGVRGSVNPGDPVRGEANVGTLKTLY